MLKYLLLLFAFFCAVPAFAADDQCQNNVTDILCSKERLLQASQFLNHDTQKLLNVVTNTRPFNYAIEDVRRLKIANNKIRRAVLLNDFTDDQQLLEVLEVIKAEVDNVDWVLNHTFDAITNKDVSLHLSKVHRSYARLERYVLLYVTTH